MPLLLVFLALLSANVCLAQDDPVVVSSRDVYGPHSSVDDEEPLRVQAHETCRGRLTLSEPEFLRAGRLPHHPHSRAQ